MSTEGKPDSAPPPPSTPTPDVVAKITGDFGRWQLRTIVLIFLCKIPSAWFMACVIYTAPTPQKGDYYCKSPTLNISGDTNPTLETSWVRLLPHDTHNDRRTDRVFRVGACHIYEEALEQNFAAHYANYTNPFERPPTKLAAPLNVIPCDQFEHNTEYNSLVTQFDLVCSRELLVSVTQSFHALGALVGGLAAYQALKHVSPRRLMLWGMLGQLVCGNLTGLVATFQLHVYFRCLTSLCCALMYTSGQVILADITNGRAKIIIATLFELFWSIGLILLPAISIFFDSWTHLYVAISSSLLVLVGLHRWIADAPRWLLRHNQLDRALQVLLEAAAHNDRQIPWNLEEQLSDQGRALSEEAAVAVSYWTIWDGQTPRRYIAALHGAWLAGAVLFNVMLLMIRSLGVAHIHVNTASLGFAEMLGVFLGLFFILYTRRRWLCAGYLLLCAGALTFLVWAVPPTIKENRRNGIHMLFWMFLKLANSCALSVLNAGTAELLPPPKRPHLLLSVTLFSRLGLIVGPFIAIFNVISKLLPISIFAALALTNSLLFWLLDCRFAGSTAAARVERVPTPNTYRRNSTLVLLRRRSSSGSVLGAMAEGVEGETVGGAAGSAMSSSPGGDGGGLDNPALHSSISIAELWRAAEWHGDGGGSGEQEVAREMPGGGGLKRTRAQTALAAATAL